MKRDMDLVRTILEQVEEKSQGMGLVNLSIEGHSPQEVAYHIKLLNEAGLLKAIDCSTTLGMDWGASSLTWDGHEFLDAIRNDTVWNKVKETVTEKGGAIPFEILKALAMRIASAV